MIYSKHANQPCYPFILPELPFDPNSFAPYFSVETFNYHHGKHHQTYVTNLNNLLENNQDFHNKTLEQIILSAFDNNQAIFNNAAQIWNHTFFWHSIKLNTKPSDRVLQQIQKDFGSFESFITEFKSAAISQFGSGWAWLVWSEDKLRIMKTSNAETPITQNIRPLLACDVWEHAYYIDYRNKRPDYVTTYIEHMINWEFVEENLTA